MLQKRKYSRQTTQKSIKNQKLNIDPNLEILEINMLSINT